MQKPHLQHTAVIALTAPLGAIIAVSARAAARAGDLQAGLLGGLLAGLLLAIAILALASSARPAHRSPFTDGPSPTADALARLKTRLRQARPDVPPYVIDDAASPSDLSQRLIRWDHLHSTGARKPPRTAAHR